MIPVDPMKIYLTHPTLCVWAAFFRIPPFGKPVKVLSKREWIKQFRKTRKDSIMEIKIELPPEDFSDFATWLEELKKEYDEKKKEESELMDYLRIEMVRVEKESLRDFLEGQITKNLRVLHKLNKQIRFVDMLLQLRSVDLLLVSKQNIQHE